MAKESLNGLLGRIVDELVRRELTLEQARRQFEKRYIVASLRSHQGSVGRAARSLGIHRNTLRNKVTNLGIRPEEFS